MLAMIFFGPHRGLFIIIIIIIILLLLSIGFVLLFCRCCCFCCYCRSCIVDSRSIFTDSEVFGKVVKGI